MFDAMSHKMTGDHRRRRAYLYVRQFSPQQVLNNTESVHRQYGLRQHAVALGWPDNCIDTTIEDQGKSGAHRGNRSGLRDLLTRVAACEVSIVFSLEVSRLCRNSSDWHQLLQFAAITDTLILDEYGGYNPNSNDRLLLGVKGALSEYKLQGIRDRLVGGQRSKAHQAFAAARFSLFWHERGRNGSRPVDRGGDYAGICHFSPSGVGHEDAQVVPEAGSSLAKPAVCHVQKGASGRAQTQHHPQSPLCGLLYVRAHGHAKAP